MCWLCWDTRHPDWKPVHLKPEFAVREVCCYCGHETRSGIYVHDDPAIVHPAKDVAP